MFADELDRIAQGMESIRRNSPNHILARLREGMEPEPTGDEARYRPITVRYEE